MREPQVQFLSGHMGKLRPRQQPSPQSPQQCLGLGPWTFAPEQVGQLKTSFWWLPPSSTMRGHRMEPRVKPGPGWDALASGFGFTFPLRPRGTLLCAVLTWPWRRQGTPTGAKHIQTEVSLWANIFWSPPWACKAQIPTGGAGRSRKGVSRPGEAPGELEGRCPKEGGDSLALAWEGHI